MRKNLALLLGNFLEFYDFTLFAYLLPLIAPIFFPSDKTISSLTNGYLFLAIGFFSRPAGAVLFGYIGDYYGRRTAIVIAILIMSVATLGIGILPSSTSIGIYALIFLASLRILQGLSAGGEYSGAGLLLVENSTPKKQFLYGAILTSSGLFGAFVAAIMAATISISLFPKESWRVLFFIGGIIGFVALWLRLSMKEDITLKPTASTSDYLDIFKNYTTPLTYTIIFGALMNVPFQMVTGFVNTYFAATGVYNKTDLMFINAFIVLFCAIVTIGFGVLSKILHPVKMMLYASLGMAIFSFPFFFLIGSNNLFNFIAAELILILLSQFFVAPAFTVMAQLFPYHVRYRGIAIGNCLGLAFLGGLTPYISSYLIQTTDLSWSPAFYLCTVSIVGFFVVVLIQKGKKNSYELATNSLSPIVNNITQEIYETEVKPSR